MSSAAEGARTALERIAEAAIQAGRRPSDVQLIAVTKGVGAERIAEASAAGAFRIGESRVQEAEAKRGAAPPGLEWHLIGRLQSNKARRAVRLFDWIQSVDSEKLLLRLNRCCAELGVRRNVLIQVNCSGEETKGGVSPSGLEPLLDASEAAEHLDAQGLMTIGPLGAGPEAARRSFAQLRELAGRSPHAARLRHLSMGMTGDFELAVAEGATMVRIGTGIFGRRGAG